MPKKTNKNARRARTSATVTRNSPVPRNTRREATYEQIAKRAYEIYVSGQGTDQLGNWLRAERELRGA
jgi:hypothetical protein